MKLRSAAILIAFMDQRNLSVQSLANYSGCSKSFIGFLRTGHKTSCTEPLAKAIAEALDVPLDVLFESRASAGSGQNVKVA